MSQITRVLRSPATPALRNGRNGRRRHFLALEDGDVLPLDSAGLPLMYEDEGMENMGDSDIHTRTIDILFWGAESHLGSRPEYQVFSNLDFHYSLDDKDAYVSPDVMIVKLRRPLKRPTSYRIGRDGPAPVCAMEVLSKR